MHLNEHWAPEAFRVIAKELDLSGDLLLDAEVVFVEEAKADMPRALAALERIEGGEGGHDGFDDAETFLQRWVLDIMVKVLLRLETRPHNQFNALSA